MGGGGGDWGKVGAGVERWISVWVSERVGEWVSGWLGGVQQECCPASSRIAQEQSEG